MLTVHFDFDYDEYKRNLRRYQQTNTKPYQFTDVGRRAIIDACATMAKFSQLAIFTGPLRNRLLRENFGTDHDPTLCHNLVLLNNMINGQNHTVTFVDGSNRRVRVKVDPQNLDNPQSLMEKPYSKAVMDNAGAWVHTLPGTGASRKPGEYHVGSGFRIILGKAFSAFNDKYQRAGVIYHELSHKILGTNDHAYDEKTCMDMALNNSTKAIKNANNYFFFIMKFGKNFEKGVRT